MIDPNSWWTVAGVSALFGAGVAWGTSQAMARAIRDRLTEQEAKTDAIEKLIQTSMESRDRRRADDYKELSGMMARAVDEIRKEFRNVWFRPDGVTNYVPRSDCGELQGRCRAEQSRESARMQATMEEIRVAVKALHDRLDVWSSRKMGAPE